MENLEEEKVEENKTPQQSYYERNRLKMIEYQKKYQKDHKAKLQEYRDSIKDKLKERRIQKQDEIKQRYETYKVNIKDALNPDIQCQCGEQVKVLSYKSHLMSQKHKKKLETI